MVWFQRIQAAVKTKAACFIVSIVVDFFRLSYGLVLLVLLAIENKSSRHWYGRDAGLPVDLTLVSGGYPQRTCEPSCLWFLAEEASAALGQGLQDLTPHALLAASSA